MSGIAASLTGLRVSGVVGLSPRSLAIALGTKPRSYLWIHLERKQAGYALAGNLPISPDPRGSPYGGLEEGMRGLVIVRAEVGPDESLALTLGPEGDGDASHALALTVSGPRSNLSLRALPDGPVLWAFHRGAEGKSEEEEAPQASPPPSFHRPHARAVETAEEREELRASIERAFLEDFERDLAREMNAAERSLTRRLEAQGGDLERTRAQVAARRWGGNPARTLRRNSKGGEPRPSPRHVRGLAWSYGRDRSRSGAHSPRQRGASLPEGKEGRAWREAC